MPCYANKWYHGQIKLSVCMCVNEAKCSYQSVVSNGEELNCTSYQKKKMSWKETFMGITHIKKSYNN